ncbi:unnamed protein product [Lactuca saligna]|uniref:Uncharacterized protein n=1 Tax=Lactuca saligna TaxID=75948 RepID=A0AA35YFX6_LACSI|nr:unnamed protein product [Lactuca saligna]
MPHDLDPNSEVIVEGTVFAFHFRINSSSRLTHRIWTPENHRTPPGDTLHTERAFTSNLGVFFAVFFLVIVLSYGSYIYRRSIRSQSSLPVTSLDDTVHSDDDDDDSTGFDDDVLGTFPTILYSEVAMLLNGETNTATHADNCGSAGCSICLADYKPADVIRCCRNAVICFM